MYYIFEWETAGEYDRYKSIGPFDSEEEAWLFIDKHCEISPFDGGYLHHVVLGPGLSEYSPQEILDELRQYEE